MRSLKWCYGHKRDGSSRLRGWLRP
jgi:hypothetical protein